MAFFKFRLPANAPAVSDAHTAAPGESVEAIRRRARHRLMGAVVLVFVAVVAFPLIFDSQPRPVAVDTPILIPDRQSTPALAMGQPVPASQAPAKPLLAASTPASAAATSSAAAPASAASAVASAPSASSVPAPASLEPGKEEVVAPSAAPKAAAAPAKAESKPDTKADHKNDHKTDSKSASKPSDDGHKAKALLEGKDSTAGKVIIQVGAFSDADKVREVRRKLEQAGLKTYTQSVEGKDGKRSTRVRVGPFDSRAEADKAAARVRKLDLPANLIAL